MSIVPEILKIDAWIDRYKPLANPVDPHCGYDFGDGCTLIETYGDHLAYLATIPDERIWTIVENDEVFSVVSGRCHVNRVGHVVTTEPWDHDVEVPLDDD